MPIKDIVLKIKKIQTNNKINNNILSKYFEDCSIEELDYDLYQIRMQINEINNLYKLNKKN